MKKRYIVKVDKKSGEFYIEDTKTSKEVLNTRRQNQHTVQKFLDELNKD